MNNSPSSNTPISSLGTDIEHTKDNIVTPKHNKSNDRDYLQLTMISNGFIPIKKCGKTLQGSVWMVRRINNKKKYIIKVTKKSLHQNKTAIINGKEVQIQENIVQESSILQYLTSNKPPEGLAKFIAFFDDKFNYFLVVEYGGRGLFSFVQKAHQMIKQKFIHIKEWRWFCKKAVKQIVDIIHWLHNTMNCAHLDISLENFTISEVMINVDKTTNSVSFSSDFQIKIIDFGLSEVFISKDNKNECIDYRCRKYVGKKLYKSPEVYSKKGIFNAQLADIWSFGIVIFCMITGGQPYHKPSTSDPAFNYIINNQLTELLETYNKISYLTPQMLDLLNRILKPENDRLSIADMQKHPLFLEE